MPSLQSPDSSIALGVVFLSLFLFSIQPEEECCWLRRLQHGEQWWSPTSAMYYFTILVILQQLNRDGGWIPAKIVIGNSLALLSLLLDDSSCSQAKGKVGFGHVTDLSVVNPPISQWKFFRLRWKAGPFLILSAISDEDQGGWRARTWQHFQCRDGLSIPLQTADSFHCIFFISHSWQSWEIWGWRKREKLHTDCQSDKKRKRRGWKGCDANHCQSLPGVWGMYVQPVVCASVEWHASVSEKGFAGWLRESQLRLLYSSQISWHEAKERMATAYPLPSLHQACTWPWCLCI